MKYEIFQQHAIDFVATCVRTNQTITKFGGMCYSNIPLHLTSLGLYHTFHIGYEVQSNTEEMRLDEWIVFKFVDRDWSVN